MCRFHYFLLWIMGLGLSAHAQLTDFEIRHFDAEDGMRLSSAYSLVYANEGFLWVGTENGVDRFDGYEFSQAPLLYTHQRGFPNGQPRALLGDSKGYIWCGTHPAGLSRFDPAKDQYVYFIKDSTSKSSLTDDRVSALIEDAFGNIWVGTYDGFSRIQTIDQDSFLLQSFYPTAKTTTIQPENRIYDFALDAEGRLWIGTSKGLFLFDTRQLKFLHPAFLSEINAALPSPRISSILADSKGRIWLGTAKGLLRWNPESHSFDLESSFAPFQSTCSILALFEDPKGRIWIGSAENGLGIYFPREDTLLTFSIYHEYPYEIPSNTACCFEADQKGNVWVACPNGMLQFHFSKNIIQGRTFPQKILKPEYSDFGRAFWEYPDKLWIGTSHTGLIRVKWDAQQRSKPNLAELEVEAHFHAASPPPWQLANDEVIDLFGDGNGVLWVGTADGLNLITPTRVIHYRPGGDTFPNQIGAILFARDSSLWIGGWGGGLFKVEFPNNRWGYEDLTFKHYAFQENNANSLTSNSIRALVDDKEGNIWIGLHGKGVDKLNPRTDTFTHFRVNESDSSALLGGFVMSLALDKSGDVWTSGTGGYHLIDPVTNQLTRHTVIDLGLLGFYSTAMDEEGFLWGAADMMYRYDPANRSVISFKNDHLNMSTCGSCNHRDSSGSIYVGIKKGFYFFHPDSSQIKNPPKPVTLTRFDLFNEEVIVGQKDHHDRVILPRAIQSLKEISLSHDQSVFTLHFSNLHYYHPEDCRYAYRMEGLQGFEDRWVETDAKNRTATFTGLTPGTYTFQVKSTNHNRIWNETPTELRIRVLPPWWQTTWAYALYAIVLAGLAYLIVRAILLRERMRNEVKLKSQEAAQLAELDRTRTRFFANISHEFRTPLTLILGPLEDKLKNESLSEADHRLFRSMRRNARRLLGLINQLLDISRLEAGKLQLRLAAGDIHSDLRQITGAFDSAADQKQIDYQVDIPQKPLGMMYDREKLETIMNNLLGNAFKFTPEGGRVSVQGEVGSRQANYLLITVSDNGPGIPKENLENIFDRFYQSDDTATRNYEGSGIGLALTRELVNLYEGEITVESEVGKGTSFHVSLPLEAAELSDEAVHSIGIQKIAPPATIAKPMVGAPASAPTLLLVEDNEDLRLYLRSCLAGSYHLLEAAHGQQGLEMAQAHVPDLIISDVMMPVMDGFALCEAAKTDSRTSHIPVILLTALADRDHRIEGLETGADDYLAKPFDAQELRVRVANLIDQRRKLREKYQRQSPLSPKEIAVNSADERFLEKLNTVLEANFAKPDFGIETLAKEMAMSRMQLLRKIKALTGNKPSEVLKHFRLQRAAQLLAQGHASVSEVCYMVGFSTPAHFSRSFKELFEVSPSEYGI